MTNLQTQNLQNTCYIHSGLVIAGRYTDISRRYHRMVEKNAPLHKPILLLSNQFFT